MISIKGRYRNVARFLHVDKLFTLLAEESSVGRSHINVTRHVGAYAVELHAVAIVHVLLDTLAVVTEHTIFCDNPKSAGIVLRHTTDFPASRQFYVHLAGSAIVLHQ